MSDSLTYSAYITGIPAERALAFRLGDVTFDGYVNRSGLDVYLRALYFPLDVALERFDTEALLRDLATTARRDASTVASGNPDGVVEWHCNRHDLTMLLHAVVDGTGVQLFFTPERADA